MGWLHRDPLAILFVSGADEVRIGPQEFLPRGRIGDLAIRKVNYGDSLRRFLVRRQRLRPVAGGAQQTIASKAVTRLMITSVVGEGYPFSGFPATDPPRTADAPGRKPEKCME